jgi:hypothetical protein
MPYWLAKTPEMVAMDRYFSVDDAGGEDALADRYVAAINSLTTKSVEQLVTTSSSVAAGAVTDPWPHMSSDWINLQNLNSGGDYWPQVPSWRILIMLRQGLVSAAQKALGATKLAEKGVDPEVVFKWEREVDATGLEGVLPLVTLWVCSSGQGTINFDVDAVRGPTSVQLVFATPAPYQQSHIWSEVKPQLDAYWAVLHPSSPVPDPPAAGGPAPLE